MFGFSLASQLFQGSAQRTWNCVTQITNLLWHKFNHLRHPIMPRSRRRHHSRSRSRSRSHSHDREPKRRKIDNVDSPAHKRSLSCEPRSPVEKPVLEVDGTRDIEDEVPVVVSAEKNIDDLETSTKLQDEPSEVEQKPNDDKSENPIKQIEEKLTITPKKTLSPRQIQKKLESEKKRQQQQLEREERERQKNEEKERLRLEKLKLKQEKDEERLKLKQEKEEMKNKKAKEREMKEEQKRKEKEEKEEQKRKEKEEKEAKRKEKEEREEAKRKEREQEKLKKQQELEQKNREKQKMEEQKQKTAQAFVNFFVPKKMEVKVEEPKTKNFMPFEVKSDMRLAPARREMLTDEEKEVLEELMGKSDDKVSYLVDLKNGKNVGKCEKTWPYEEDEEDVVIIEEDFGESIYEDKQKSKKMRVKFLKFHENKRPAYYGTWRKKSSSVKARKPFAEDKVFFDYDVDSDDDWEEEEQGESLNGSDDEDKENEVENDDYEVDNEFFVPHGHLSDDEVDDEAASKLSPESHKQKLKLLKDEFDQDMQTKTNKLKPRSIGCIWYSKDGSNVDEAIDRHLRPLAMITNGQVIIQKRKDPVMNSSARKSKELCQELIPAFLKHINQNSNKKSVIVGDFISYMQNNNFSVEVSKAHLGKRLKEFAQWKKCLQKGSMFNKYCWVVEEDVKKKYNVE